MAPGLVPLPRDLGGRRLLLASLTGSERRGNSVNGARPRAVASSSLRTSSPARILDWEQEEWKLRPWRPASCLRLVIPADVVSHRDDMLLSPNAPGGGDSSTRQASSSTTHSVTGPAPSASMVENPASVFRPMDGSLCSSVYFYLPLHINTLHVCFIFRVSFLSHGNSSVSRVTSITSTVPPGLNYAAKSLSQFFFICLCFTMPAPLPIGTLWLQTSLVLGLPLVGRGPHYFVPGVWRGRGVSATRSPDTPPP